VRRRYAIILFFIPLLLMVNCAFFWDLPQPEILEPSTVYDIKGRPVKGLTEQNQLVIELSEIPESFQKAIIAVEDKNFYLHHGIDIAGIFRAVLINLKERRITAGGSTITQQTAKNLFLSNERTLTRKIKELVYALQLEKKYSKDEILTMYCNTIYFGHGAYGIEVAARTFFGKPAKDINIAEAALLAGLPNWPAKFDPYINPEEAKKRQKIVLMRMVEENYITEEQMDEIYAQDLDYKMARFLGGDAPYFITMVKDYVSKKYGERMVYQGGLKIYTTLDLDMQKAANDAVEEGMSNRPDELQAALIAMDVKTGQIRALIGGRDYSQSTYNRVFAERQPGSTFKPIMYSLAVKWGISAADMIKCEEVEYELPNGETYKPHDYGENLYHWKSFTIKEALMISDNVIAVRVNNMLGAEAVARHAEEFGFKNIKPILSLPLGSSEVRPIDMVAAYSVFANQGIYNEPVYIMKVVDNQGNVLEKNQSRQKRILSENVAYIITDMLKGVLEPGGTGQTLAKLIDRPAAGKTGTTDKYKDAWFVGYTPRLCCAVWVGYDQGQSVNLPGSVAAGPIWANFIHDALQRFSRDDFVRPDGVKILNICLDSGQVATSSCPRTKEMAFIPGTEPENICYIHDYIDWQWSGESE